MTLHSVGPSYIGGPAELPVAPHCFSTSRTGRDSCFRLFPCWRGSCIPIGPQTTHHIVCLFSFRISRADIPGNVFVAPAGEALLCNSSLLAWRLIDSDSTRLYSYERRVPRCMPKMSPDSTLQWISSKLAECGSCS